MNILLVYPKYPDTFWGFKHALKFVFKKAVNPPLGLMTISSMLQENWNKKLVDLNIEKLSDKTIDWSDYVFISAMNVQHDSVNEIIQRCQAKEKTIVCGGPLFTEDPDAFKSVNHLILNEAEITLPQFLNDLKIGTPKRIYASNKFANIKQTPVPDYSLVKLSKYNTLNLQFTRGCPFNCEFCDITALLGHKVRTKTTTQIISELEAIYNTGWRKSVFFVDDNFIGNKQLLKQELLPEIIKWMKEKNYPFTFSTEASINLSDDNQLMELMAEAGFVAVFVGIETTEMDSLNECGKIQNTNRNLVNSVHKIQANGMEVNGGFILGFDSDTPNVFQKQISFIKESGIITAMVGLLNAPKKTRLYKRLRGEGRITGETSGNNTDFTLNFEPKMDRKILINGYSNVIRAIYGGKEYYKRVLELIRRYTPNVRSVQKINLKIIAAFILSHFRLGIIDRYRNEYWKLFLWTLFNRPKLIPQAVTYSVYGFHFRRIFKKIL